MPFPQFNRQSIHFKSLSERINRVHIATDHISLDIPAPTLSTQAPGDNVPQETMDSIAHSIHQAKRNQRSVILAFGAHTIKNGLAPILIELMRRRWVTHLATNGAGIIHDWEFAFQGASSEDVKQNIHDGYFGNWQETGYYINLAINIGAYQGLGYGESVGNMISNEGLTIPGVDELLHTISKAATHPEQCASALDLLHIYALGNLQPGFLPIAHPYKSYSVQCAAYKENIPFTGHPMFGHDIIYNHPMNHGASIGRTAERDWLTFVESMSRLDGGVYLSVGSAIMSPMIFEKALSMVRNVSHQKHQSIENFHLVVVDLAHIAWDWQKNGEPPTNHPAYYLRYAKTFSRMGGTLSTLQMDNRNFLSALFHALKT